MQQGIFERDKIIEGLLHSLRDKTRVYAKSSAMPKKFIFICGKNYQISDSARKWLETKLERKDDRIKCIIAEKLYSFNECNIFDFENLLAEISDKIIIILESPGSFCELGMFVNAPKIRPKLIAINEDNPNFATSFVSQGPLQLIKNQLVLYQGDIKESKNVHRLIRDLCEQGTSKVPHNTPGKQLKLKAFICELLNIIYLFAPICADEIEYVYEIVFEATNIDERLDSDIEELKGIKSVLKLLFRLDLITYHDGYYFAKEDMKFSKFAFITEQSQINQFRSKYLARMYKLDKKRVSLL